MASPFTPATIPGFSGGTITGPVTIDTATSPELVIKDGAGHTLVTLSAFTGGSIGLGPDQNASLTTVGLFVDVDIPNGDIPLEFDDLATGAKLMFVTPAGAVVTAAHAAPGFAALGAGQCALWFDQTNGVGNTKLMAQGKSADGTLLSAIVAVLA